METVIAKSFQTIASYELGEDSSMGHHDQLECEGSEIFESSHCDLSTSSDDSHDNDLVLEVEHDIYDSENAKIPLFENSDVTVLQALASYFMWFTEHPSTSKN